MTDKQAVPTLGLNLLAVRSRGGVGVEQFVRNVVGAIEVDGDTTITVAIRSDCDHTAALGERFFARHCRIRLSRWRVGPTAIRILVEMLPLSARLFGSDVVLSINNFGPLFGKSGQRRIVVIHDVWFLSPAYTGPWFQKWWFRILLRVQLLRTDHVVTVSEFSKREIGARLNMRPVRISVVPNCLDRLDRLSHRFSNRERGGHLLLVGSDRANKNVGRAVQAYGEFANGNPDAPQLVVVGRYADAFVSAVTQAVPSGVRAKIDFKGYVTRNELLNLIATSEGMVFPSLYEGYGIPVIEAIALGRPVMVSRDTVCAELAGPMGIVVRGDDVYSIRQGFARLLKFDPDKTTVWRSAMLTRIGDCKSPAHKLSAVLGLV